jgi:hypothetical protein
MFLVSLLYAFISEKTDSVVELHVQPTPVPRNPKIPKLLNFPPLHNYMLLMSILYAFRVEKIDSLDKLHARPTPLPLSICSVTHREGYRLFKIMKFRWEGVKQPLHGYQN